MATEPMFDDRAEEHVSAAACPENVARHGTQEEVQMIVAMGPRGALAVAGLAVFVLLDIWIAFFVFVFLVRGAVG